MKDDHLETYRRKRDFDRTPEPQGGDERGLTFVVQKHAARALHYDFRLEDEGVMPSWAVPKGPSYDPKVKRLAMHVEDHPLDYQDFEGRIPAGEYGGGSVIVWDRGTYRNITERRGRPVSLRDAIDNGHVSVWLDGTKLRGGWSLTRTGSNPSGGPGGGPGGGKDAWIMVKRRDETADPSLDIEASAPNSVESGRSLEDIAKDDDAQEWTRAVATWRPPMLAELMDGVPAGEGWVYERKLDGLRCVAVRNGDAVDLWSRTHLSFTGRFPEIAAALADLPVANFVLDGEIVALDGDRTSFALLQQRGSKAEPLLFLFDVLHLLGADTTEIPLVERKALLEQAVTDGERLRVVSHVTGDPAQLLEGACASGWEGLIAKRADSKYVSGRSSAWRKLKCSASQELVIGGWTEPRGSRIGFGALLVGYYDEEGLRYSGKVGTGFDTATLTSLHAELEARSRPASPFVDPVKEKTAHWSEPELVANIAFTEWTPDGKLRHPRFEGLRPDKDGREVRRELS